MYRRGGGVQNPPEKTSKNAFRPVPVPKSTFPGSQSRSRMRLSIAASIAFLFHACFKGVSDSKDHDRVVEPPSGLERGC